MTPPAFAAVAALALLTTGAVAQSLSERPADCRLAWQVVHDDCAIDRVYQCRGLGAGETRVETWEAGRQRLVVLLEEGLVRRRIESAGRRDDFLFPPGMVRRVVSGGAGAAESFRFTRVTRSGAGEQRDGGIVALRHLGREAMQLRTGPVEVLRIEVVVLFDDGTRVVSTRFVAPGEGVLLGMDADGGNWRALGLLGADAPAASGPGDLPRELDCRLGG